MTNLYMMVGLPASGKSTIAKVISEFEKAIIVSTDEIREELFNDIDDQEHNAEVFDEVESRIKFYIANEQDVIFDATNVSYKRRRAFLEKLKHYRVKKIAILVATPYEECIKRNAERGRKVPEEVITRMYHNFYIPQYYEGFDEIQIRYNSDYMFFFDDLPDIPHDNPHHTLSVLEHCRKVLELLQKDNHQFSIPINYAGGLHDIGKLKTKTFVNAKGETTEVAHFYDHENVSAYDSLFYINLRSKIEVSKEIDFVLQTLKLIQWHMKMHFNLSEKTINKYKNMLGEDTWNELEILHKADCEAR